ncbi:TetR/AcrR family transcriptional regulator [Streptomyces sp. NPDC007088]|uniref:TetR/AcrR family transcriptional regulator n=1 Tax=Streptomyces sp. NPDC007088 TaxID=3364773 RepID=UPI0036B0D203
MARPRSFDEDRALDAAMRTFWAQGYEGTSTQDLCEATGLGRSSVYHTFHSKHALFSRALARYTRIMTGQQLAILEDATVPPRERVRALLAWVVDGEDETRRDGHSLGCMTVSVIAELAGRDPVTEELLTADTERRLAALRALFETGQRTGEFPAGRAPAALAQYVNATLAGMRIAGRAGADRATLESVAEVALDAIGG